MSTATYPPADISLVPTECQGCDGAICPSSEGLVPHLLELADGHREIAYYGTDCSWVALHSEMRDAQFKDVRIIQ